MSEHESVDNEEAAAFAAPETGTGVEAATEDEKSEQIGEILTREFVEPGRDRHKSLSYAEVDAHSLITGGKARIIAAAEIAKRFPTITLVATSTDPESLPNPQSHAETQQRELLKRHVPPEQIMLEQNSVNTVSELTEMLKVAVEKGWLRIDVVTNNYHVPRCRLMFERIQEIVNYDDPDFFSALEAFQKSEGQVGFVAAEEVLTTVSSKWRSLFEEVEKSDGFKGRVAAEEKGMEDIRAGRYKSNFKPQPRPSASV